MSRRKHHRAYGVTWDESQTSPTCVRIGQGQSVAPAAKSPDNLMAIQSKIKGCVLDNLGAVQYYLDPTDKTLKEDGSPSVLTGADGQVMVEVCNYWLRYWYGNNEHNWLISKEQFNGATRSETFYKNNENVSHRYIGAYEATLYDISEGIYTNGLQLTDGSITFTSATKTITHNQKSHPFTRLAVGDKIVIAGSDNNNNGVFTVASTGDQSITVDEVLIDEISPTTTLEIQKDWANDKLCSISGKAPINTGTRANFRAAAANRGTGWRQQDYDLVSTIQLLYLIEYASWYSQSMIGDGLTDWATAWGAYNDSNPINNTGLTNGIGSATGNLSNGDGVVGSYMSYRGIENFFSHIWKWVDGINVNDDMPYVSNVDTNFADDTSTNYTNLGVTLAGANGYQVTLEQINRGFLPASVGGGSSIYITDYYSQSDGWRVVLSGNHSSSGASAGIFSCDLSSTSAGYDRNFGGRLCF